METEGSLFVRVKAFFPLLGPVILNALNDTRERAIALDVRGFDRDTPKTYLNEAKSYRYSTFLNILLLLILAGLIVWRLMG
jgi:energy-coupling factor transport system permease protein